MAAAAGISGSRSQQPRESAAGIRLNGTQKHRHLVSAEIRNEGTSGHESRSAGVISKQSHLSLIASAAGLGGAMEPQLVRRRVGGARQTLKVTGEGDRRKGQKGTSVVTSGRDRWGQA